MSEIYRYFKGNCDVGLGPGTIYNEFCGETATRQAEQYNGRWFSSKDTDYHEELGIALCDRYLSEIEHSEGLMEISSTEFEAAWLEATGSKNAPP